MTERLQGNTILVDEKRKVPISVLRFNQIVELVKIPSGNSHLDLKTHQEARKLGHQLLRTPIAERPDVLKALQELAEVNQTLTYTVWNILIRDERLRPPKLRKFFGMPSVKDKRNLIESIRAAHLDVGAGDRI